MMILEVLVGYLPHCPAAQIFYFVPVGYVGLVQLVLK